MAAVVARGFKRCPHCGQEKALTESHWYNDKRSPDGFQGWCRKCMNGMPKPHTTARICRRRARQRASQILIERHRAEFDEIYTNEYAEAIEEAERLAANPANAHFDGAVVRLRAGPKHVDGEEIQVQERVDQEWCAKCSMFHARDHHLTSKQIREAGLEESFEQFNAGVQLAQTHGKRA